MKRKLTAEEKKNIRSVVEKYDATLSDDIKVLSGLTAMTTSAGLVAGLVLDLVFTAGFGTVLLTTMGLMGGAPAALYMLLPAGDKQVIAGKEEPQKIKADTRIFLTLVRMHHRLHEGYQATFQTKDPAQLQQFIHVAEEFKADIKKLSPAFNATAVDGRTLAAEELKFSLVRKTADKDPPRTGLDDEIIRIKTRIELLRENPAAEDTPPPPEKRRMKLEW